jgi:hypothetical protein
MKLDFLHRAMIDGNGDGQRGMEQQMARHE